MGWDGMGGCKRMRCGAGVDKIAEDFLPQFNYVEPSVLQALQLSHAIPWHTTHIGTKAVHRTALPPHSTGVARTKGIPEGQG